MDKNSIFRIASQTKAIVSVGIMILQEEGKLLIADPEEELVVVYFTQLIPADGIDDHGKPRTLVYQALID